MKNVLSMLVVVLLLTGCARVEPGYSGILVDEYGDQRGVNDFPLRTGRVWHNPFTQTVYKFPTYTVNYQWTQGETKDSPTDESFIMNDMDGATVGFDVGFSLAFMADSVPKVFVEFRRQPDEIVNGFIRNVIRDEFNRAASKLKVTDIFGSQKSVLLDTVNVRVESRLAQYGIIIKNLAIIGAMRVDDQVQKSINAVLTQSQRAIEAGNKVQQAEAEANQKIETARGDSASAVIRATGQAEANRRLMQSLTPQLIEYEKMMKWNGILPQVTGGATPILDFRAKQDE
jgi:regulator of protease activity HflC (stomatin/prohibitin superfamily)